MKINPKENIYFAIKLVISIIFYILFFYFIITLMAIDNPATEGIVRLMFIYAGIIIFFLIFRMGIMVGHLKGNAIKITPRQFPDIYDIVVKESQAMGLSKVPDAYIWQRGGLLNAFTLKFVGTNYVVIYSDVLAEAYKNGMSSVAFIIGHELGHVKRKHFIKKLLLFPGSLVPFLGPAYSRACEYTADSFGAFVSPEGAVTGMMLLAAGPHLAAKVDTKQFTLQTQTEDGFWHWYAEKVASHPNLTKRVSALNALYPEKPRQTIHSTPIPEMQDKPSSNDHSKYMPG